LTVEILFSGLASENRDVADQAEELSSENARLTLKEARAREEISLAIGTNAEILFFTFFISLVIGTNSERDFSAYRHKS